MYRMDQKVSLADMNVGEEAVITGFSTEEIPARFYEMGLLPGTLLKLQYRAPFNGPVCVSVNEHQYLLALRKREARYVLIERTHEGV